MEGKEKYQRKKSIPEAINELSTVSVFVETRIKS
jgi:hypothetical protein